MIVGSLSAKQGRKKENWAKLELLSRRRRHYPHGCNSTLLSSFRLPRNLFHPPFPPPSPYRRSLQTPSNCLLLVSPPSPAAVLT
ncbi:hypothetical protein HPP92_018579 [Vanilla planifolia]|uniref:Uncharacterized protein n=1 Tax=Vanilla planifolia TaxID=51239 RepID=A0A835Q7A2_VANPL|nr:hypothetical protein HPP92_018579 [Vanilla planifolia]